MFARADDREVPGASSEMRIDGRFTLGHWECHSNEISGDTVLPNEPNLTDAVAANFHSSIYVRVQSFDCGNSMMEDDMFHALKSAEYPTISYVQQAVRPLEAAGRPDPNSLAVLSKGELSVAGVKREIELEMGVFRIDKQTIRIIGGTDISMTDFGIRPPTALFGLIKARNKLHVQFRTDVTQATPGAGFSRDPAK